MAYKPGFALAICYVTKCKAKSMWRKKCTIPLPQWWKHFSDGRDIWLDIPTNSWLIHGKITASGVFLKDYAWAIYPRVIFRAITYTAQFHSCCLQGIVNGICNTVIWWWWEELILVLVMKQSVTFHKRDWLSHACHNDVLNLQINGRGLQQCAAV